MSVQPTRLVIGRFGRIGHGELKGELRNITFFCMVCKFSFFFLSSAVSKDYFRNTIIREHSGSVVEWAAGSSLNGVTGLWSLSKTRPCLTERLLMGGKESNQTNKQKEILSVSECETVWKDYQQSTK